MQTELLTIPEFCKMANIGRTTAYSLINAGLIKAIKIGKKTLIPRTSMNEWISTLQPYKREQ